MATQTKYITVRQSANNGIKANLTGINVAVGYWDNASQPTPTITSATNGTIKIAYDPDTHGAAGGFMSLDALPTGCALGDETLPVYFDVGQGGGGTGGGAYTVVITVNDGSNPIQNATVSLTSGATYYSGTTDVDGEVTFNTDAATWVVAIVANGYTFSGASLVIAGNTGHTYSMALAPSPTGDNLCVRGDLEDIFGIPNIIKWAILSSNAPSSLAGQAEVTTRINWAISVASTEFRNAMRQGGYLLSGPNNGLVNGTTSDATVWQTNIVAIKSGLYLYMHLKPTQRGVDGTPTPDHYDGLFYYAEQQLNFIRSKKLKLDAQLYGRGTNGPMVTHAPSKAACGNGIMGYGIPENYDRNC